MGVNDVPDLDAILERLRDVEPIISTLRAVSGNAGMSVGILHRGRVIHRAHYGFRDVERQLAPDGSTIYSVASLTKAMVAAGLAVFVDEGRMSWDSLLADVVPEYAPGHPDRPAEFLLPELATSATLLDLLAHRLGVTDGNSWWAQKQQTVLVPKTATPAVVAHLAPVGPFREQFLYNNWGYGLAGEVLERLAGEASLGPGETWSSATALLETHLQATLFRPLGLTRTTLEAVDGVVPNVAAPYMASTAAEPIRVRPSEYRTPLARAGAGAGKSSLDDLLRLYGGWMAAGTAQAASGATRTEGSPFRRVCDAWSPHMDMGRAGSWYGLGWVLAKVPGQLGLVGINGYECAEELPVVCRGAPGGERRVVYHQGSHTGNLCAVYMLPETESAVVVLGNSCDLCDSADWVGQLLLEALLDTPKHLRTDFVSYARSTVANAVGHYATAAAELAKERIPGTSPRPLDEYCGIYEHAAGFFRIEVERDAEDGLVVVPQGCRETGYRVEHFHNDVFWWPFDRDDDSRQALYPRYYVGMHKFEFLPGEDRGIKHLHWQIDKRVSEGEIFTKSG